MMTPEDFLRSISPGEKQPENLGLDQYIQVWRTIQYNAVSTVMTVQYKRYTTYSIERSVQTVQCRKYRQDSAERTDRTVQKEQTKQKKNEVPKVENSQHIPGITDCSVRIV